jgi:hypothetical protein
MSKILFNSPIKSITAIVLLLIAFAFQASAPCDGKVLKENAKKQFGEGKYTYDMSKLTQIQYKAKPTLKELEVPLFIGEKYKLVFNAEALPKSIVISIYNRDKESKKRKLLFTTKDAPADQKHFIFDLSAARKAFIDYEIPAGDSTASGGCLVFIMGYK